MPWYDYLAHFMGGAMLVNAVPHFVQGICGARFQSPFASPPGVGESGPLVNVIWGLANFAVAAALLLAVGPLDLHQPTDWGLAAAGGVLTAIGLAAHFGRVRSSRSGG